MKVHNTVRLDLSREELEAVFIVYNMLYNIEADEEKTIDNCIGGGVNRRCKNYTCRNMGIKWT